LTVAAAPYRKVIILRVLDMVCLVEGYSTLLDPVHPEVGTEPAREFTPDAREKQFIRLTCHFSIALEVPRLRR